ncbi:RecQ family ATP-dependent DNA helicase [Hydrotalea sandarakina]|jgi:ATP-dependent DNA helicase RecQ|uniref:ATP-dependent DNA helicase RecQ n=1 Tax=Hydrotalea sandarakina TaxID=1004304 RepID=A0A2W7RKX4_9BACT|nr:ATP-dependent DNA helicase RecQ [Hydrotalea sandarakina]PZX61483.1 ATP-dependent DNA helicase RecQ [Hydrotalea sandarakina]
MHQSPKQILKQYWGYDDFRGLQLPIIESVLAGNDTLALLPTGGGKSICFQVPTLIKGGMALVISPLIALMADQVMHLQNLGISAIAIESSLSTFEIKVILEKAIDGKFSFLYVSPERLQSPQFLDYLPDMPLSLVVVDEAHCISQWGYDFRPSYLNIVEIKNYINAVPFIALTASATSIVRDDIIEQLELKNPSIFSQSFYRKGLSYSVIPTNSKINTTIDILKQNDGSSLVYCSTRKQCREVAHLLQLQGLNTDFYHAGLTKEERQNKQQAWIQNKIRIMVCTNAFGMGINKTDVRNVIHYNIPDCIENYYQEAGRVGRDNNGGNAVLLYQPGDLDQLQLLPEKKFPSINTIRTVYQAIADYLQLPVGVGQGNYYEFNVETFLQHFKLNAVTVMNVLKVLEQEGHLSFTEAVFAPSQVMFLVDKDVLFEFQKNLPAFEAITQTLLRTYQGILNNYVTIYERQVAKNARISFDTAREQLEKLNQLKIISYKPQKETPQIYWLLNRAPAASLTINFEQYFARKKNYEERIAAMLNYTINTTECRSRLIGSYFSDKQTQRCGICDNCLKNQKTIFNANDYKKIQTVILNSIPANGIELSNIIQLFTSIEQTVVHEVIQQLIEAKKIHMNNLQKIYKF